LAESEDPDWIVREIARIAARLRGREFTALVNPGCGHCDLQHCCPLVPNGRQVTS
jgi:hypothetical protein